MKAWPAFTAPCLSKARFARAIPWNCSINASPQFCFPIRLNADGSRTIRQNQVSVLRLLVLVFSKLLQKRAQPGYVDWFGNVIIESSVEAALDIRLCPEPAQRHGS